MTILRTDIQTDISTQSISNLTVDNLNINDSSISAVTEDTNITLIPTGTGSVNCDKYIVVNDEVTTTNEATVVFMSAKKTSGTPAAGLGQKWAGYCESLFSSFRPQFEIESTFTDVTASQEDANLTIRLADDGSLVDRFKIDHLGTITTYGGNIAGISSAQTYQATDTISEVEVNIPVSGNGGAVTLTSNPQIAAGTNGERKRLIGTNDTNTLTVVDGNGLALAGSASCTLGENDIIEFIYYNSLWIETSRSNN